MSIITRSMDAYSNSNASRKTQASSKDDCYIAVMMFMGLVICLLALSHWEPICFPIPEFHIDSVVVPPLDAYATALNHQTLSYLLTQKKPAVSDFNWTVTFGVKNPMSSRRISYDMVRASIFYEKKFLSATDIEKFHLDLNDQKSVHATFSAPSAKHDIHCWLCRALEFNLKVQARVTLHAESSSPSPSPSEEREFWMRATCHNIKVPFSSNTVAETMTTEPRKCLVRLDKVY